MTGPYTERAHDWGDPLPGQGGQAVCRVCGCRMTTAPKACSGGSPVPEQRTVHEYDPHG